MWFQYKNSLAFKIALHVLVWVMLLFLPYLFSNNAAINFVRVIKFVWVPMVFHAIFFYTNYCCCVEKFLFNKKTLTFVLINLALILLFTWLNFYIREFLNNTSQIKSDLESRKFAPPPAQYFVYKDFVSFFIPIIFAIAAKTIENWSKIEAERNERATEMLNWELQHLKYQLQPHFFFNSLNTIYALIERSPNQAQETVHSLSKLMRFLLYDSDSGKTKLKDEFEFMTEYINLMKLRISERAQVNVNFPDSIPDHYHVAPLLFISLIENAFKHGISASHPSKLLFNLTLDGKKLCFSSENTNFPKTEKDKSGSGIGLVNLRKRLELLYPNRHTLKEKVDVQTFKISLEIETD